MDSGAIRSTGYSSDTDNCDDRGESIWRPTCRDQHDRDVDDSACLPDSNVDAPSFAHGNADARFRFHRPNDSRAAAPGKS